MNKYFVLIGAIVLVLSACETQNSDEVEVSAIYQDYAFIYHKSENKTQALAEFRNGGNFGNDVILVSPSAITMNGVAMEYSSVPFDVIYHHYGVIVNGKMNTATYIFTDHNAKTYTNVASFDGMDLEFPANFNAITKSTDLVFSWIGSPIGEAEVLSLTFTIQQDSIITNRFSTSEDGATSITIPASELSVLINGTQCVKLQRDKRSDLQAATEKGGQIVERLSTEKDVAVFN